MAVPKRKLTRARTARRFAKWAFEVRKDLAQNLALVPCAQCGEMKLAHTICRACGAYGSTLPVKATATKVETQAKTEKVTAKTETKPKDTGVKGMFGRVKKMTQKPEVKTVAPKISAAARKGGRGS